jgi:hypothetical protein
MPKWTHNRGPDALERLTYIFAGSLLFHCNIPSRMDGRVARQERLSSATWFAVCPTVSARVSILSRPSIIQLISYYRLTIIAFFVI